MARVVILAGSPCSGKTTLGALMCPLLPGGAALIDKDTVEWPLANAALAQAGIAPDSHDCDLYKNVLKAASYETMERIAEQNVKSGVSAVLVAPYSSHVQDPTWLTRLSERCGGAPVHLVWITAAAETLYDRKGQRGEARDLVDGPAGDLSGQSLLASRSHTTQALTPPSACHQSSQKQKRSERYQLFRICPSTPRA